ncbi:DEAD/DEAH box helicase [Cellulomonas sp. ICMP 17802]|uniref:DEAD/DEAH box helicase n=1 Tax=Cellulomonas sp. ICMP 17802 TaxID=3239199 RepID=UPI00351B83DE
MEEALRRLALRFPSTERVSSLVIEVPLDDLMTHVAALQRWPEPGTVKWDEAVARVVTDSMRDAQIVAERLAGAGGATPTLASSTQFDGAGWKADLTEFQRDDITKLLSLRHGANFSVPGAGKTRVALAVFHALREQGEVERLLIVGPKSSYGSWASENLECFETPLRLEVMDRGPSSVADAVVINYERLSAAVPTLTRWLDEKPTLMVLDEAHRMKLGADGVYGAACLALGPYSRRRLVLTGTPAPNGVRDLESLFAFVWPGTGRQRVVQAVGGGNLAIASQRLRPLFARTTKKQLGLPPVTAVVRRLDMPPLHQEVYRALLGEFSARAIGGQGDLEALGKVLVYLMMAATSPALLSVGTTRYEPLAYQVAPLEVPNGTTLSDLLARLPRHELSPKYEEVIRIVQENAAVGRKTLVWSTFIRSLTTLRELLAPYRPALVHGGSADREAEVQRFREDPACLVLLSNPATLGEGISLHHECHDAVYVDRDFAAGRYLQSVDRIHRLGLAPDAATRVTVLVANETIDEVIEQRLGVKLDFMARILDDASLRELADLDEEPAVGGGLDASDLQSLIGHLNASSP